jgi:hypothetical protein
VAEEQVPEHLDRTHLAKRGVHRTLCELEFAIERAKTTGTYDKPAGQWQRFRDAIHNGTARSVEKPTRRGMSVPKLRQESVRVVQVLESKYIIVGVPNDNDIASRTFLAPDVHPQVEHVMQMDIREQRRNHRTLWSTHLRALPFAFLHHSRLQPFLDQPENAAVGNAMLDEL